MQIWWAYETWKTLKESDPKRLNGWAFYGKQDVFIYTDEQARAKKQHK